MSRFSVRWKGRTLSVSECKRESPGTRKQRTESATGFKREIGLAAVLKYDRLTPAKTKLARKGINHHSIPQGLGAVADHTH